MIRNPVWLEWNKNHKASLPSLLELFNSYWICSVRATKDMHQARDSKLTSMKGWSDLFPCKHMSIHEDGDQSKHCAGSTTHSHAPGAEVQRNTEQTEGIWDRRAKKLAKAQRNRWKHWRKEAPAYSLHQPASSEQLVGFGRKAAVEFDKAASLSTSD